jgi:hypothetical protein
MCMSYPHTSSQNGCAERIIRTTNDIMQLLMFQASIPAAYWAEALCAATYLLNLCPTKTLPFATPQFALFGTHPDLSHLRVLGANVILISQPPHQISLHHAPLFVSFLAITLNTKVITALT